MLKKAISLLESGPCTCVILNGEEILRFTQRGIAPLTQTLLEQPRKMKNAVIADRIIGKAAALLAVYGGAAAVYGAVMSGAGLAVLREHGIEAEYGTLTGEIRNRANTDICPMEKTVLGIDSPEEAFHALLETQKRLAAAADRNQ